MIDNAGVVSQVWTSATKRSPVHHHAAPMENATSELNAIPMRPRTVLHLHALVIASSDYNHVHRIALYKTPMEFAAS